MWDAVFREKEVGVNVRVESLDPLVSIYLVNHAVELEIIEGFVAYSVRSAISSIIF